MPMGMASVTARRSASFRQGFWSEVSRSFVLIVEPEKPARVEKVAAGQCGIIVPVQLGLHALECDEDRSGYAQIQVALEEPGRPSARSRRIHSRTYAGHSTSSICSFSQLIR